MIDSIKVLYFKTIF